MIQILLENQDLVIVYKPSGVLSVPARESTDPRRILGRELEVQLKMTLYPVHRLDFEVSGLIIYAKNANSHQILNSWFENKKISKVYRALTTGPQFTHFPKPEMFDRSHESLELQKDFLWKAYLHKGKKRVFESPQGKEAITQAKVLFIQNNYQMWELHPVTGRSHQLRWELSRHGYPILGDELYGSSVKLQEKCIALRAVKLNFTKIQNEKNNLNLPAEISLIDSLVALEDLFDGEGLRG